MDRHPDCRRTTRDPGSNPVRTEPTTNKKFKVVTRVSPRVQNYVWNDEEGVFDHEWLYEPVTPDKKYV